MTKFKNWYITESHNDAFFIKALAKRLNSQNSSDATLAIDENPDFASASVDSDGKKLRDALGTILTQSGNIRLGIILDLDDDSPENRINFINQQLLAVLQDYDTAPQQTDLLKNTNDLITLDKGNDYMLTVGCYFMHTLEDETEKGEMEDLLKKIAKKKAIFADCLAAWTACFKEKGKTIAKKGQAGDIADKEILKLWIDFYERFDTLKKKDRYQSEKNTNKEGLFLGEYHDKNGNLNTLSQTRGYDIYDFDADIPELNNLRTFLQNFTSSIS
jgi:hypothetical protein